MDRNIFLIRWRETKIACAGVSIMEPDVLVMDEPSSNLDAASILDLEKDSCVLEVAGENNYCIGTPALLSPWSGGSVYLPGRGGR